MRWMTDAQRMRFAAACSLAFHLVLLVSPWGLTHGGIHIGPMSRPAPIVLNLKPPEPEPLPARRLVDVHTPATEPVEPNDLIAVENSKATDVALRDGTKPGPRLEEIAEHDALAAPVPALTMEPEPAPAPAMDPAPNPPAAEPPTAQEVSSEDKPERIQVAKAKVASPPPVTPEIVPNPVAKDTPPPETSPPPQDLPENAGGVSRGRLYDKVNTLGFPGFEASKDQVAPYLHEVRRRVEKRWNAMLLTRYSGTSPTEVVIDCAIAPDGTLARVEIVGEPKDRVYAALCKDAVEKAGPFKPFPFTVPDMYRNRNLEIRWTFSFL